MYRVVRRRRRDRARNRRRSQRPWRSTTDLGRPWTRGTVHQVLTNEKYVGNNVWNRISFKLKKKRVRNTPEMWIRADGAFEPIVDRPAVRCRAGDHPGAVASALGRRDARMLCRRLFEARRLSVWADHRRSRDAAVQQRLPAAASAACCEPTSWSASRPIATTATSRSIARFARMHPQIVADTIAGDREGRRTGRAGSGPQTF